MSDWWLGCYAFRCFALLAVNLLLIENQFSVDGSLVDILQWSSSVVIFTEGSLASWNDSPEHSLTIDLQLETMPSDSTALCM